MFVLLKLLLHFFQPLLWIILLFLYAVLGQHAQRRKLAFRVALVLLLFFTNPFIIKNLLSAYEMDPVQLPSSQKFEAGILLGGLASYSAIDNKGYFNNAADRFIQTALLYRQGHIQNIIVAAGYNSYIAKNYFSEAGFIKEKLVHLGIPAERIYVESQSRNTEENAFYAKKTADSTQLGGPFLLISSAMHLRRAAVAFRKAGLSVTPYPCHFLARGGINNILEDCILPSSHALNDWNNLIRELLGLAVYQLKN
jgi:uncharacterized SAM-binding protein YcdF (DUF218 family)